MKYIFLVGDGMQDRPIPDLEGTTPLEVAKTPALDFIAREGKVGWAKTIPAKMQAGSDVAIMSLLGYDPQVYYTGRGPLEAVNLGIELKESEVAFRCNLVTVEDGVMVDYSAGHISSAEAKTLINFLNQKLSTEDIHFYPGVSYRHIMVAREIGADLKCFPPHDIMGKRIDKFLPEGKDAQIIIELMQSSRKILLNHEINQVRIDLKENPANMVWFWGQGKKPELPRFKEKFGVKGRVISAVDLIKGLGRIIGLEPIYVEGATGYYDTNYSGKAEAALEALKKNDFVFLHVEAPDEAGHNGDLRAKISVIEKFDSLVVGTILKELKKWEDFRILVTSDHPTPITLRTHTREPIFFALYGKGIEKDQVEEFNEKSAQQSAWRWEEGYRLMDYFIRR
ncbi:MAG: cofactor-independent phosphoglycerate mutase [Candidatus Omnitrophica bacterium]|nr:cofactor-independent phosphoglycerate mutase [Candidatus Omnitrophota bacterium]